MSRKLEELEGLERRLTLELPAEKLEERVEDRLERLRPKASISGFRPGKVPRQYLRRRFGSRVRQEQAEALAQSELRQALAELRIWPFDTPTVDVENLEGQPRAVATFEVFPPLPELDLAGLELEVPQVEVTDDDVEEMRRRLELPPEDVEHLRPVMEKELQDALEEERLSAVEEALLERYPDLELPAALLEAELASFSAANPEQAEEDARASLTLTFLFAEIARQWDLKPDPTRLWKHTQELANDSADPSAELDEIWSDGNLVQELEEELLRQDVVEVVLAEAKVKETPTTFRQLALKRRGVVDGDT